jgi:prepilin peptidase CpaA
VSIVLIALAVLLFAAAIVDIVKFAIPNTIVLAIIALFGLWLLTIDVGLREVASSIAAALILFAIGLFLFSRNVLGGGDVKLISALGLWTGLAHLPRFLLVMAVAGGALAVVVLIASLLKSLAKSRFPISFTALATARIPYGVAIAAAGLDFVVRANRLLG